MIATIKHSFILVVFFLGTLTACSEPTISPTSEQQLEFSGFTMGPIIYTVKLVGSKQQLEDAQLTNKVDALLVNINKKMSTYDKQSELSSFNQYQGTDAQSISVELAEVMLESIRLAELTQGALDVTVGPLVNLWSFGPGNRAEKVPSQQLIDLTQQHIGIEKIQFSDGKLLKTDPQVYIDLSAIAKGYAVDKVAELLEQHGFNRYIVDIGGEMRINGHRLDDSPWVIAVEKPIAGIRAVQKVIIPGNNAVATSGDYRNYFEEDGVRYSHTIDPESGWPINHKLVSVTVIHPSSMTADGLATAIEVMGPEKGYAFAQANNLAVYLISKTEQGFAEQATEQFKVFIAK